MSTTALAPRQTRSLIADMSAKYGVEPAKFVEAIKKTVFPQGIAVSNEQLFAFLTVADHYELNPFTRELYAFPGKGGAIIPIVSIDGRVTLTLRQPQYDGAEFYEQEQDGHLVSVTCKMFRKDQSRPTVVTEYMSECKRNTEPWNQMPHRMLRHKAFSQAARYAFGFAGLYDEDEARDIVVNADPVIPGNLELEHDSPLLQQGSAQAQQQAPAPMPVRNEGERVHGMPGKQCRYHVGKMLTEIFNATEIFKPSDLKGCSLVIDQKTKAWTIPAGLTNVLEKILTERNIQPIECDEAGKLLTQRHYAATDADLPDNMFEPQVPLD